MSLATPLQPDLASDHPSEQSLRRYVANEMGTVRKKKLATHLDQCPGCRALSGRIHEVARRFRDFERLALARVGAGTLSNRSL